MLLLIFCVVCYSVRGNIGDFDEHWKQRSNEAKQAAQDAYRPDPYNVTQQFNSHVRMAMEGINKTRRELKQRKSAGPCVATNPIDKCWRCDPNWEKNRKRLADCAIGFGQGTTGGKAGRIYVVTDPSDNDVVNPKPGTLRHAAIQLEPLWIIFAHSMTIRLSQELLVTSHKTIDARGSSNPTIISQGNRFIAPANRDCKQVTKRDYAPESVWMGWNWRSENDLMMNGAFFKESGRPMPLPKNHIAAQPGAMAASLTRFSGSLKCVPNKPC
ncbi:pectate lyase-like [Senna tora]|uniref:Pectate lyase-like n=1 Tax=Senna tora TaxID=362788 RepID=A0A834X5Z9_9FABA|nr:pectate lyase-like [Senna tora]